MQENKLKLITLGILHRMPLEPSTNRQCIKCYWQLQRAVQYRIFTIR